MTARAEAVFNADPRRFAADTQANTREIRELLREGFPSSTSASSSASPP